MTRVQTKSGDTVNSSSALSLAPTSAVASHNLLVVKVATYNAGITVVVAGAVNGNFQQVGTYVVNGNARVSIWCVLNASGGNETVTVTPSAAAYVSAEFAEYHSDGSSFSIDSTATGTGTGGSPGTSSLAISNGGEIAVAVMGEAGGSTDSFTASSGFTLTNSITGSGVCQAAFSDDVGAFSGSLAPSFTTIKSLAWAAMAVSFAVRAGVQSGGAYIGGNPNGLQCPGIGANYASIQSSAANSISGDIQIDLYLALPDWTPSSQQYVASLWPITGNPAWFVAVATSGALAFTWEESGGTRHDTASTAATGFTDGQPYWIRITLAVSNGAVKYYTSSDGVTYTQLGSTVTLGVATSLRTSIGPVAIGAEPHDGVWASGSYYRAKIYSGIGGTLAMDANFSEATPAAQTFAESSSNAATVTIHSTDSTSFGFYFTGSAGGAWETASNWSVNATPTTTGSVFVETNAPANPIVAATVGVLQWDIDSDIALSRLSIGSELDAQGSVTNADLASIESVGTVVSLENLTLENHTGSFNFSDINGLATLRLNGGTGQVHIDAEGVAVSVASVFAGTLYNDQYDADGYVQSLGGSNVSKATLVPGPQAFSDFVASSAGAMIAIGVI